MKSGEKIFVVLTLPNYIDTTASTETIRVLTDNPWHALAAARKAMEDRDRVFVARVRIYCLEWKRHYTLWDFTRLGDLDRNQTNPNLVFLAYWANERWIEAFRHGFKAPELKELPIETAFKAGNLGKLRVVALLDSDPYQVGDEVGTMEEAFWLSKTQPSAVEVSIHNAFGERVRTDQKAVEELAGLVSGWKS